jgi:pilus assembly protein CpaF
MDERLVEALCRAAEGDDGDADIVVRANVRRLAPLASATETERLVRAAVARLDGLGALDALIHDGVVDEVLVNAGGDIWVESDGALRPAGRIAAADLAVVIERILAPLGRRLDRTNPVVDARLPDGSRVCAVVPPVALDGICLSVRRFRERTLALTAFGDTGVAALLDDLLAGRANVIVSGATSSGKTSLVNTMLGRTVSGERIVIIEDTAELLPSSAHLVRLEGRPPTPDGPPAVTLEQLVRTALRLRPDRLVVGEVRGPDVLLTHHGSCTSRSGSSARMGPWMRGPARDDDVFGGHPPQLADAVERVVLTATVTESLLLPRWRRPFVISVRPGCRAHCTRTHGFGHRVGPPGCARTGASRMCHELLRGVLSSCLTGHRPRPGTPVTERAVSRTQPRLSGATPSSSNRPRRTQASVIDRRFRTAAPSDRGRCSASSWTRGAMIWSSSACPRRRQASRSASAAPDSAPARAHGEHAVCDDLSDGAPTLDVTESAMPGAPGIAGFRYRTGRCGRVWLLRR